MKYLITILIALIAWSANGQARIHELPAKTNADSTWLILTGNPSTGRLYKMTAANLRDSVIGTIDTTSLSNRIDGKQSTLISGNNIKTINSESILGSGNIEIVGGGGGGGENIDSTLSIGNVTDDIINFEHDYSNPNNTGILHTQNPLVPLGTDALYLLRQFQTSEYGVDTSVAYWSEYLGEYQSGQYGAPTARKNVVYGLGYNIDQNKPNEASMRLAMESNYIPGAGAEWFEFHFPEVKTKDGEYNRWYSITGEKDYPQATHLWRGNTYTFFDISNYPAAMLFMNNATTAFTASTFRIYDSDGDGGFFAISHNDPTGDIYMTFDGAGTGGLTRINTDNAILFNTPSYAMSIGNNGYVHLGSAYAGASQRLQVDGNIRITGAYYDSNNDPGTSGQVLSSVATGTDWITLPAGTTDLTFSGSGPVTLNSSTGTDVTFTAGTNASLNRIGADLTINAIPSGSNTQVQFNNSGALGGSANFTWDGVSVSLAGSTSAPSLKVGTLEFQGYSLSNAWIGENVYYDGSFKARQTGPSALFYFQGAEGQFRLGASVTAGSTFTQIIPFKINESGSVSIGGNAATNSSLYTGGTALFNNDGMSIGKNGSAPTTSALIEMTSTTRGLMLPRMTKAQRDAISGSTEGLMIYQTDNTPGLRVFNGTNWMRFTETAD